MEESGSTAAENLKGITDVKGRSNGVDLKDHGFRVGDFVWAKIRSHSWLPGQVFDPRDASEFAKKHSQQGRLLVVFFGDGSCSWCLPSQLIPFVENFNVMSVDGASRSFLNAIQCAVDEVSRLVESKMTCECVALEKRVARPMVVNFGIKAGVLVPEVDVSRLSAPDYEPAEILSEVTHLAKAVSFVSLLEFGVLKSWLSAFYCATGCHRLPIYHECLNVEGMEDKNEKMNVDANDFSVPIEVPIFGRQDDDHSPAVNIHHRKKRKSVVELMRENAEVNPKSKMDTEQVGNDVKKHASLPKKNSDSGGIEEGIEVSETLQIKTKMGVADDASEGTSFGKAKKIEVAAAENSLGEADEESGKKNTSRERKKSKYLCPPYTSPVLMVGSSSPKMVREFDRVLKVDVEEEHKIKASVGLCASASVDNGLLTVNRSPRTVGNDMLSVDLSVNELLSELQSAAVDTHYLSKKDSLDMVWAFASAFRSSTCLYGSDYEMFHKCKTSRKRKLLPSHLGTSCLTLTFSPQFPLPSREEIVQLFSKFGRLSEKGTNAVTGSQSVRIVFKDSEAAAFTSTNHRPFDVENIATSPLQHPVVGSKSHQFHPKTSPHKHAPENPNSCQRTTDDIFPDVPLIKQTVDRMTQVLENYSSKFSVNHKSALMDEMKNLLEHTKAASKKVQDIVEITSQAS